MSQDRLEGYKEALRKHGLPIDEKLIVHHDLTAENARLCAIGLFEMKHRPDGLFTVNDPAAIQAMLVAREKKLRIPNDLAIVGFSNEPISAFIEPALTTLAQPLEEMGREAVQVLLRQITDSQNATIIHEIKVLKTSLIVRASSLKKKTTTGKKILGKASKR